MFLLTKNNPIVTKNGYFVGLKNKIFKHEHSNKSIKFPFLSELWGLGILILLISGPTSSVGHKMTLPRPP
jgi:hypothetical protein